MTKANSLKTDSPFRLEADGVKIYFLIPISFKLKLTNGVYVTEKNIQDEIQKLRIKFKIKEPEILRYDISDTDIQRKFYSIYLNTSSEEAKNIFEFALRKTAGKTIYDVERDYKDMIKTLQIDIYNNCRTINDYDSLMLISSAIEAVKNETGKINIIPTK